MQERLSLTQRAALAGASEEKRAEIEYESSMWMVACPCGWEQSVWDLGGVRYKASGAKKQLRRCGACGKRQWHQVYHAGAISAGPVRAEESLAEDGPLDQSEWGDSPASAPPVPAAPSNVQRAGLSFGAVFLIIAVVKIFLDRNYSGPVPSWFLVFLIAGAVAGSSARRRNSGGSGSFGCLVVLLLMFLFSTLSYFLKVRELTG